MSATATIDRRDGVSINIKQKFEAHQASKKIRIKQTLKKKGKRTKLTISGSSSMCRQSACLEYNKPAKLRIKLSGTLFSSLSIPRPSKTSELPIRVKMAMAHKIIRINVRFKRFSVEDNPDYSIKFDLNKEKNR